MSLEAWREEGALKQSSPFSQQAVQKMLLGDNRKMGVPKLSQDRVYQQHECSLRGPLCYGRAYVLPREISFLTTICKLWL